MSDLLYPDPHDHCDHDPTECSYQALVQQLGEVTRERDEERERYRALAKRSERLNERRQELDDLLRSMEAEQDRLREITKAGGRGAMTIEMALAERDRLREVIRNQVTPILDRMAELTARLVGAEVALGSDGPIVGDLLPEAIKAVVAERNRLRDLVDALEEHWDRVLVADRQNADVIAIDELLRAYVRARLQQELRPAEEEGT